MAGLVVFRPWFAPELVILARIRDRPNLRRASCSWCLDRQGRLPDYPDLRRGFGRRLWRLGRGLWRLWRLGRGRGRCALEGLHTRLILPRRDAIGFHVIGVPLALPLEGVLVLERPRVMEAAGPRRGACHPPGRCRLWRSRHRAPRRRARPLCWLCPALGRGRSTRSRSHTRSRRGSGRFDAPPRAPVGAYVNQRRAATARAALGLVSLAFGHLRSSVVGPHRAALGAGRIVRRPFPISRASAPD